MNKTHTISTTYISIYTIIILLLASCANIVPLSGGSMDTTPPKPIKSIPENYSLQFNKDKIEILFDEFIVLKDVKKQMLISPPLNEVPDVSVKGKTLVVKLNEKLKENTTYTLFFGNSITDLTEGNAVPSYEFVFSTGNILDSMIITGKVVDAFTQKPEKDFFVMLYNQIYDSVPCKEKPYYLSKTNENGDYTINNLRNIPYKIFALKDANNNIKFDQPTERIAYLDSLVVPHIKPIVKTDSTFKDSIKTKIDIVKQLSLSNLRTFLQIDSTQRVLKAEFIKKGQVRFAFRYPVKNLNINILNNFEDTKWKVEEWNATKDTLTYWILKPEIDTLNLIISDNNQFNDTLNLRLKQKIAKALIIDTLDVHKKKKDTKIIMNNITKIIPKSNLSQTFGFYNNISFAFPNPMLQYDSVSVILIEANDTLNTYAFSTDIVHRKFLIKKELKQGQEYKLILKENLLTDIFGQTNDSLVYSFKTNTVEDLGSFVLNVNIKDTTSQYIIQLLTEREDVLEQRFINKDTKLIFKNLTPTTYLIKAIVDINRNKKWDTGNYLRKIQPEKTIYYPAKIIIRANWDLEEKWEL